MELLDRYLNAVRFWLPRAQQDDVTAELGEDIRSQIEEQEGKLGRKLTTLEVASLLKERGRPMLVASRYHPQQYLIGPVLFPVYRFVMLVVVLCYLIPWFLIWMGLAIFDPYFHADLGRTFGPLWGTYWLTTFVALGTVTLVFAILERADRNSNFLRNWDPLRLPQVRDLRRIPRLNSAIELAVNVAFVIWWTTDMWSTTVFNLGGVRVDFTEAWKGFLWTFLALAVASILLAAVNLARPYWTWRRAILQLLLLVAAAVAWCALFRANLVARITMTNLDPARAAHIANAINTTAYRCFPFAVVAGVLVVASSGVGRLIWLRSSRRKLVQRTA